jgi:hypothetical protein
MMAVLRRAMCMKHLSLCLLFAIAIPGLCCADVTKFATANPSGGGLAAEDRKTLQDSSRFHEVYSTSDLPAAIVALCADKIADPGPEVERD